MGLAILPLAGGALAEKIDVCHKGKTISIDNNALKAHQSHGDVKGRCKTYSAVLIFRCGVSSEGGLAVTVVSSSVDIPVAVPQIFDPNNCADANAALMDLGFNLKNVTSGSVEDNFETEYLYARQYLESRRP